MWSLLVRRHLSDQLLWSIFQSSFTHITHYKITGPFRSRVASLHSVELIWGAKEAFEGKLYPLAQRRKDTDMQRSCSCHFSLVNLAAFCYINILLVFHIKSYHIIAYHIISYHIISYYLTYIWLVTSQIVIFPGLSILRHGKRFY